eukprot:956133-Rhodomonas_salina.1
MLAEWVGRAAHIQLVPTRPVGQYWTSRSRRVADRQGAIRSEGIGELEHGRAPGYVGDAGGRVLFGPARTLPLGQYPTWRSGRYASTGRG